MAHKMNWAIEIAMQQADQDRAFENLPGAGKPLKNLHRPKDALLAHILKEHEARPMSVLLKQEVATETQALQMLSEPEARKAQMKKINELQLKLALEMEAYKKYG